MKIEESRPLAKRAALEIAPAEEHPHRSSYLCQLRLRRAASRRMLSLDCGCQDSWTCRCTDPPLSVNYLDSWVATCELLLANGCTPMVPIEVLQALWRRGGADRRLAQELHQRAGGVVA